VERAQHPVAERHQLTPVRLEVHSPIITYGSYHRARGRGPARSITTRQLVGSGCARCARQIHA
jgi:hypothetical protein